MKHLVALLTALLLASPDAGSDDAFRSDMLRRLRAAMPGAGFAVNPKEPLTIRAEGGRWGEATFNLHRVHAFCQQASDEECESTKQRYVAGITAQTPRPEPDKLRLIVRDRQYLDYLASVQAAASDTDSIAIYEAIGDDLYAVLALDGPQTIQVVGDKLLRQIGLTRADAWKAALKQTRAILPALPRPDQLAQGAVAIEGKEYQASLLVDLQAWSKLAGAVGPDLFLTVVSDSFVFVGRMPNGAGMDGLRQTVREDCQVQERCVSPNVYRFRNGRWIAAR